MAGVNHTFVLDITTVLGASAFGGFVAHRFRQPVLLGYLVCGLIIGPFGFGQISQIDEIKSLAEIGVAFLLFALGVEFSLAELKRVQDIAIKGSILQIGLTIALVATFCTFSGWVRTPTEGIFMGAVLSLSSTAVVLKTLTERGEVNTIHGQVMLAILIAQDLALGLMLAVLPALNQPDNLVPALIAATLKAIIFFACAIASGYWIIPRIMTTVANTENSELFLLTVIALCLGVALTTAKLGLSIEMGAFVAGLTISEIDYADQALAKMIPLRDTFACLFFASIGMLINPTTVWQNFGVILGLVALVMIGKAGIIFPIIWRFGYSFKTSVISSLGLNQIGEFSFVLAVLGERLGFINQDQYDLLIGTTAITLVLTPIGMKFSPEIAQQLAGLPLIAKYLRKQQQNKDISLPETISNHVVVAGYGRVGRVVVRVLRDRGYPVLVIENSEAAIRSLRKAQIPYIFGDADAELVLEKAHLDRAKAIAIALPDPSSSKIVLQQAINSAPGIDIVARSHSDQEIDLLTKLGAAEVVQPEFEAALEMGRQILSTLGEDGDLVSSVLQEIRTDRYLSIRDSSKKSQSIRDCS
ncbi:MAG: cation:proton antiporter [Cyanobacteria bacterium J06621_8]